eukprot:GHVU01054332.1.p2 GENE.GHVU01054332.1~~GHVU01054332.1.p2  ORF type:complete len:130 (-),score=3.12 GHVU01054332.1:308-697(-)
MNQQMQHNTRHSPSKSSHSFIHSFPQYVQKSHCLPQSVKQRPPLDDQLLTSLLCMRIHLQTSSRTNKTRWNLRQLAAGRTIYIYGWPQCIVYYSFTLLVRGLASFEYNILKNPKPANRPLPPAQPYLHT